MGMVDVVVSLDDGAELTLTAVDVGTTDGDEVLAFTIEGIIRELESELMKTIAGKSLVPTEVHFRVETD